MIDRADCELMAQPREYCACNEMALKSRFSFDLLRKLADEEEGE